MLKKSFSFVLLILITVGVFLIAPFSVYSTEEVPDYLSFQADMYSKKFDEIFVDAYSKSFAKTLYNEYQDDALLMAGINAWEDLHIVASPKYSFETGQINKKDFYKVILFDLFDYSKSGTLSSQVSELIGNPEDIFKTIKNERTSFALSFLKFICKENNLSKESLSTISPKDINLTADKISKLGIKFSDDVKVLSDVKKILDVAEDINKAVSLTADYLAVKELKEGTLSVLDLIINDTSNPGELRNAAQSYKECSMQGYQKVLTAMTEGATFGLTKAYENLADEVWKEVVGTIPGGTAVLLGMKGGRALCNSLFSTDKITKAYYQLEADVLWEETVTKALKTARNSYINNKTTTTAKTYMSAVELLKDTVLLGFDYSEELLSVAANSKIVKNTNEWFGKYNKCISLINQVNSFKTSKWNNYGMFEDMVLRRYNQLYFPDYESYENLTSYQNVPITSIELSQKKEIQAGDEGYIFDYINLKANPDNYNDILNPTWESSDESIIQFETDYLGDKMGSFKCLKEGTCTLTATQFPDIKGSITLTVGGNIDNSEHDYYSDFEYYVQDDDTAIITRYRGNASTIVFPDYLSGHKVVKIGGYGIRDNSRHSIYYDSNDYQDTSWLDYKTIPTVTRIVLPDTIEEIGEYAFVNFTSLNTLVLPESLQSIKDEAFNTCSSIKELEIPESVKTIGDSAFGNCTSLENLTIPCSTKFFNEKGSSDYDTAFSGCTNLVSLTLTKGNGTMLDYPHDYVDYAAPWITSPNFSKIVLKKGIKNISNFAFVNCENLKQVVLPDSIEKIGDQAFENCSKLSSIQIPKNVKTIGYSAFGYCKNLAQVGFPDDLESIGRHAFLNCENIKDIDLPDSLRLIGDGAFSGTSIKSIVIPDTLLEMGDCVFDGCIYLKDVKIPCGEKIGYGSFGGCENIEKITITKGSGSFGDVNDYSHYYYYYYDNNYAWRQSSNIQVVLEEGIKDIAPWLFSDSKIKTFSVPDSVTSIGEFAFSNSEELTTVSLGESVVRINGSAFSNCNSLQNIYFSDYVRAIGDRAFYGCENLNGVYISDLYSWCDIDFDADEIYTSYSNPLYYAHNLYLNGKLITDLVIPDNVTTIKKFAFGNNTSIEKVVISDSVKSIEKGAFGECSNLKRIFIGNSVTDIAGDAFDFCENLNDVYLTNLSSWCNMDFSSRIHVYGSFFSKPHNLYYNGELLTDLIIPNNVTNIGAGTFAHCNSLLTISLPDSVKSIDSEAFAFCESLMSVTIPKSVKNISENAFYYSSFRPSMKHVFYSGDENDWNSINGESIFYLSYAEIHYDTSETLAKTVIHPTCEEQGYTCWKCNICNEEYNKQNYINALGHDYIETVVPPSCINQGYTTYICANCDNEYRDSYTDMIPHKFENGICSMCGKSEDECMESEHPYDSIQLLESMVVIHAEDEYQIKFAAGNIDIKSISYKTDDLNIAYTTSKGIVHALSAGSTEVHITINDNIDLVLYITVLPKESSLTEPSAIESSEPVITESGTTEPTEPETINSIPVKTENPMQVLVEDVHINLKDFNQENELIFYPFSIENAVGEISYNLVSTEYEYFAVDKNTGALHINNNIKTGSYTIKVKIVATGNAFYKSKAVVKAINIYVKDNNEVPSASESTPDKPTEPTETQPVTDKPTEPVATEPTEPLTDKPTEPNTTNPIVTNPRPTENESTTPAVENPTVKKKANPVKVTVKTKTVKLKKLKKKVQKVKSITVKNAQGKVTYKLVKSGITKKIRKLVKINSKGVITIKRWKKAKKGTYIIRVKITAKGNTNYNLKTITKTVKIKIK